MSYSLNKSESLRELSNIQQEAISGGESSVKPFPQIPKYSDLGISIGKLFGFGINQTSFYKREDTSDKISKSGEDGELNVADSNTKEIGSNQLTII